MRKKYTIFIIVLMLLCTIVLTSCTAIEEQHIQYVNPKSRTEQPKNDKPVINSIVNPGVK